MLKTSTSELKQMAKNRLSGDWGNGIIATIVPLILATVVGVVVGLILFWFPFGSTLATTIVSAVGSFMIIRMVVPFAKGKKDVDFGGSFGPSDRLVQFIIYMVLIFVVQIVVQIPFNLAFYGQAIVFDSASITDTTTGDITQQLGSLWYLAGSSFLLMVVTIKLYFTTFLIADQGLSVADAAKQSWDLTKGNIWRIILFDLSFIGWYLLSIFTCGILLFYVIPYHTVAQAYLYLEILEENGQAVHNEYRTEAPIQGDWVEVERQAEPEEEKDSWDF